MDEARRSLRRKRTLTAIEKRELNPKKLRIERAAELLDMVALPRIGAPLPEQTSLRRPAPARGRSALALSGEIHRPGRSRVRARRARTEPDLYLLNDLQAAGPCPTCSCDLAVVRQIADDVIVMERSKLVEANTTDELFNNVRDHARADRGRLTWHPAQPVSES